MSVPGPALFHVSAPTVLWMQYVVRRHRLDDDVLDALVVGRLEVRERRAGIRVVVGVVRLDRRDRCAHVGLSGRLVRTIAELEVRRDRNREQDPDDDDHDEKLDQGETALAFALVDPLTKSCKHSFSFVLMRSVARLSSAEALRALPPNRGRGALAPLPVVQAIWFVYGQAPVTMSEPGPVFFHTSAPTVLWMQ